MKTAEQLAILNRFMQNAPVDVFSLAQSLGITCHSAYLDDEISGMLEHMDDGSYKCSYNASHSLTRQRFTVAHELGHYFLHRKLIGEGLDDNRAYRSTEVGKYHNTAIGPKEETEANRFAASILMPVNLVKEMVAQDTTITNAELATQFNVSEHAMRIRRNGLGC